MKPVTRENIRKAKQLEKVLKDEYQDKIDAVNSFGLSDRVNRPTELLKAKAERKEAKAALLRFQIENNELLQL